MLISRMFRISHRFPADKAFGNADGNSLCDVAKFGKGNTLFYSALYWVCLPRSIIIFLFLFAKRKHSFGTVSKVMTTRFAKYHFCALQTESCPRLTTDQHKTINHVEEGLHPFLQTTQRWAQKAGHGACDPKAGEETKPVKGAKQTKTTAMFGQAASWASYCFCPWCAWSGALLCGCDPPGPTLLGSPRILLTSCILWYLRSGKYPKLAPFPLKITWSDSN